MIPCQFMPSLGQESFILNSLNCLFLCVFVDNNNNRWESRIISFMEMHQRLAEQAVFVWVWGQWGLVKATGTALECCVLICFSWSYQQSKTNKSWAASAGARCFPLSQVTPLFSWATSARKVVNMAPPVNKRHALLVCFCVFFFFKWFIQM